MWRKIFKKKMNIKRSIYFKILNLLQRFRGKKKRFFQIKVHKIIQQIKIMFFHKFKFFSISFQLVAVLQKS